MGEDAPDAVPPRRVRIAGAVALVVVVAYLVASFEFFQVDAPFAGVARNSHFAQSWRLFAPAIIDEDRSLHIQARWQDANGGIVESEWLDVTAIETGAILGHVAPGRVGRVSRYAITFLDEARYGPDAGFEDAQDAVREYATVFAAAYWGVEPVEIRWRIVRHTANDFENRLDEGDQYPERVTLDAWLPAGTPDAGDVDRFAEVIRRYGGAA